MIQLVRWTPLCRLSIPVQVARHTELAARPFLSPCVCGSFDAVLEGLRNRALVLVSNAKLEASRTHRRLCDYMSKLDFWILSQLSGDTHAHTIFLSNDFNAFGTYGMVRLVALCC